MLALDRFVSQRTRVFVCVCLTNHRLISNRFVRKSSAKDKLRAIGVVAIGSVLASCQIYVNKLQYIFTNKTVSKWTIIWLAFY